MAVELNADQSGTSASNEPTPTGGATHVVRLGTRGSMLARTQSQLVARALEQHHPGLRVELSIFKTTGDRIADRPLHEFGGKGLFTKELEQALLDGSVDFVVHSYKDVPVTMPLVPAAERQLLVAATPRRADPRDLLVCARGGAVVRRVEDLPERAQVGTGSLRRRCQLLADRPDLLVEGVRGNIDTRLRKLRGGRVRRDRAGRRRRRPGGPVRPRRDERRWTRCSAPPGKARWPSSAGVTMRSPAGFWPRCTTRRRRSASTPSARSCSV